MATYPVIWSAWDWEVTSGPGHILRDQLILLLRVQLRSCVKLGRREREVGYIHVYVNI